MWIRRGNTLQKMQAINRKNRIEKRRRSGGRTSAATINKGRRNGKQRDGQGMGLPFIKKEKPQILKISNQKKSFGSQI